MDDWDADGLPKYIIIKLRFWKGSYNGLGRQYKIQRNMVNSRYCPVLALMAYMRLNGAVRGPMFTSINKATGLGTVAERSVKIFDGKGYYYTWVDKAKRLVNVTYSAYNNDLLTLFKQIPGLETARAYSIRRSATKWAARCGASTENLLSAGRWVGLNSSFQRYIEAGQSECAHYSGGEVDPIREVWVYHESTFYETLRPV